MSKRNILKSFSKFVREGYSMDDVSIDLDSDYRIKSLSIGNYKTKPNIAQAKEDLKNLKITLMRNNVECGDFKPNNIDIKPYDIKNNTVLYTVKFS